MTHKHPKVIEHLLFFLRLPALGIKYETVAHLTRFSNVVASLREKRQCVTLELQTQEIEGLSERASVVDTLLVCEVDLKGAVVAVEALLLEVFVTAVECLEGLGENGLPIICIVVVDAACILEFVCFPPMDADFGLCRINSNIQTDFIDFFLDNFIHQKVVGKLQITQPFTSQSILPKS